MKIILTFIFNQTLLTVPFAGSNENGGCFTMVSAVMYVMYLMLCPVCCVSCVMCYNVCCLTEQTSVEAAHPPGH